MDELRIDRRFKEISCVRKRKLLLSSEGTAERSNSDRASWMSGLQASP